MSYHFDVAARAYAESFVKGMRAKQKKLKKPITHVYFFIEQTAITPWEAHVYFGAKADDAAVDDADLSIDVEHDQVSIPPTIDEYSGVLASFKERHDIEDLRWSDCGRGLLCGLYYRELLRELRAAKATLEREGIKFAKGAELCVWDEDHVGFDTSDGPDVFDESIKEALDEVELSPKAIEDLAQLCFAEAQGRAAFIAMTK